MLNDAIVVCDLNETAKMLNRNQLNIRKSAQFIMALGIQQCRQVCNVDNNYFKVKIIENAYTIFN